MKKILILLIFFSTSLFAQNQNIAIAIHGGAGTILKKNISPEQERAIKEVLDKAVSKGYEVLKDGGSSIDAVTATIVILENSPYFNAGKGAVFTSEGRNELDCALMEGKDLNAGTASGIKRVKNPILLAKEIMLNSPHVMLSGEGADKYAEEAGLEIAGPEYFFTENRYKALQKVKSGENKNSGLKGSNDYKYGTVGCVAVDAEGNLAAGTSTGGMTNKKYGRIGDSPIIGAGTYANNNSCAVSCTGHGEYFIRLGIAADMSAMMIYGNMSLFDAANTAIHSKLQNIGGSGGLISIDKDANIAMPFNTEGMYRAYIDKDGNKHIAIYGE